MTLLRTSVLFIFTLLSSIAIAEPANENVEVKTLPAVNSHPIAVMTTNYGVIELELNRDKAPLSVANFERYVREGFYNGTTFHRVISNFMIQGGGFTEGGVKKQTHAPIKNEARNGLRNIRGSIAMARTNVVDSATSQFFINVVDNPYLDHGSRDFGYAVFGKVISGMEIADKIRYVKTGRGDKPYQPVVIQSIVMKP